MATIDLTNGIQPQHKYRPVKPLLSDLREAIDAADTGNAYPASILDKMNRNDLVYVARTLGVVLPFPNP